MKRALILLLACCLPLHVLASRYIEDDGEGHSNNFSDQTQLALYVFIALTVFVVGSWNDKRAYLRWGSKALLLLALVFVFTKPDLLMLFVAVPILCFFLYPVIYWTNYWVRRILAKPKD